ncbi:GntR family transcriptional regulator [Lachnospiraceae bacterium OttesenSCG-928-E19]|nr:GntR family transcriptional regulator [Lachnospiraceae bacterium OttesenSCG-928-E19]
MSKQSLSLADKAYEAIKNNILNLTYPPGMPFTETALATELGMSRSPIRTAIKMLQTEGLITTDYHKSLTVKGITDEDINEMFQLRELIEGAAFQTIFTSGRFEEYSYRLEEKVVRMCAVANDIFAWEVADTNMHMEIISIYDNHRITRIYENNLSELIRIGQISVRHGMGIQKTNQNLKTMVSYMRKNEYEKAYHILKKDHFTIAKDSALKGSLE